MGYNTVMLTKNSFLVNTLIMCYNHVFFQFGVIIITASFVILYVFLVKISRTGLKNQESASLHVSLFFW